MGMVKALGEAKTGLEPAQRLCVQSLLCWQCESPGDLHPEELTDLPSEQPLDKKEKQPVWQEGWRAPGVSQHRSSPRSGVPAAGFASGGELRGCCRAVGEPQSPGRMHMEGEGPQ